MSEVEHGRRQVLIVARHGDRWDYAYPEWRAVSDVPHDPPLTPLGHQQAERLGRHLSQMDVDFHHVLCSPYLRTLQTADHVAEFMPNRNLKLEAGLWEAGPEPVASARERFRYYPRVDLSYESKYQPTCPEVFPDAHIQRCHRAIHAVVSSFAPTENLVMVTHAAPAICVATALLIGPDRQMVQEDLRAVSAIGPCSFYRLERTVGETQWRLADDAYNEHVRELVGQTRPWHFLH